MRLPNDTPEQLKLGLVVLGILGVLCLLPGIRELVDGHGIRPNLLYGILLTGIATIAWRKAFYY